MNHLWEEFYEGASGDPPSAAATHLVDTGGTPCGKRDKML